MPRPPPHPANANPYALDGPLPRIPYEAATYHAIFGGGPPAAAAPVNPGIQAMFGGMEAQRNHLAAMGGYPRPGHALPPAPDPMPIANIAPPPRAIQPNAAQRRKNEIVARAPVPELAPVAGPSRGRRRQHSDPPSPERHVRAREDQAMAAVPVAGPSRVGGRNVAVPHAPVLVPVPVPATAGRAIRPLPGARNAQGILMHPSKFGDGKTNQLDPFLSLAQNGVIGLPAPANARHPPPREIAPLPTRPVRQR